MYIISLRLQQVFTKQARYFVKKNTAYEVGRSTSAINSRHANNRYEYSKPPVVTTHMDTRQLLVH